MTQRKIDIAYEAWDGAPPDWIVVLARACDETSQNAVARRLDRSASMVSALIAGKYAAKDLSPVETLVRGVFLGQTVNCPALGALPSNQCLDWQRKAQKFAASNPMRVRMYRACARCALNGNGDA